MTICVVISFTLLWMSLFLWCVAYASQNVDAVWMVVIFLMFKMMAVHPRRAQRSLQALCKWNYIIGLNLAGYSFCQLPDGSSFSLDIYAAFPSVEKS